MRTMDRARWERASPLLDELLDVAPATRPRLLAALREEDATLADDLAELLGRMDAVEKDAFLESPVTLRGAGMAGQTVGAYTIVRELGEGGMGSVWLAQRTDGRYEGNVAIKFLHSGGLPQRGSAERFAREGSILARLAHPNIARLIDAGITTASGQRYLVLEYVDGVPVDRYCETRALGVTARVRLFLDVLAAVAHAHNRLILHRDIKPGNILVTAAGEVKLLDFGIAKLIDQPTAPARATELTHIAGRAFTPAFASPEQVEDGEVTTATDVYALGVLLYVLLAGTHPTAPAEAGSLEQMQSVVKVEPRRMSEAAAARKGVDAAAAARLARELRGDLDTVVAKALKKAPAERYANAQLLADDLRRYLSDEPITARPDAAAYVLAKFVRRHRVGVAAGTGVALALAVGAGVAAWEANEARRQREQAEGLIEFMLVDLRKKLEPVGRLEVLDVVGERALAYYATQDVRQLDADSLGRRARALHLIGEIADSRGDLAGAQQTFQKAADSTGELIRRSPLDTQRLFEHAQSVYWVGYSALRRGHLQEAESSFHLYLDLARRMLEQEPGKAEWAIEHAYANDNLGVVHWQMGQGAAALAVLNEARQTWQRLVAAQPALHLELANTLGWMARAHEAEGRYDLALDAQRAKRDALGLVPAAGSNRSVQELVANAHCEAGRMLFLMGRYAAAVQDARLGLEGLAALSALDPANEIWLAHATQARLQLAETLLALGRHEDAQAQLEEALRGPARRLIVRPENVVSYISLAGRVVALGRELPRPASHGQPDLAGFVEAVKRAEAGGVKLRADQVGLVSRAELLLGDQLARSAPDAARAHWRVAMDRLTALPAQEDPAVLTLIAHLKLRLGAKAEAMALARKVASSLYRHPDSADLQERLAPAAGERAEPKPARRFEWQIRVSS
jgi:serine/threonine protein kinase